MKDGICPKCDAKQVHLFKNTSSEMAINLGVFESARVVYYICTNCGYVEIFIEDETKLPKIAEKYPKVK